MAKKIPTFKPHFNTPGEDTSPMGCQPVPTPPQQLKDRNQNSLPTSKPAPDKGKKDK